MYADDGLDVRPKLVSEEQCDCVVQECRIGVFIDWNATEMCYLKIIRKPFSCPQIVKVTASLEAVC